MATLDDALALALLLSSLLSGCRDAHAVGVQGSGQAASSLSCPVDTDTVPSTTIEAQEGVTSVPGAPRSPEAATPQAAASPCPEGMAKVGGFCIDRYEGFLVTRAPNGERTPHPYFQRPSEGVSYEARSEGGQYPQGYISRVEAQAACANAQKRLCSMHEWQRACVGSQGTTYPYGDRWKPDVCNMDKPHLLSLRFGWDARRWHYEDFNDPSLNQEPGFLTKAGALGQCTSDAGTYDLVGNLHEWVNDDVDATFVARLENDGVSRAYQPWHAGNGVFMGGFFSTHEQHGPGCKFTTIAHEPGYHDYSTGFRCCTDATALR